MMWKKKENKFLWSKESDKRSVLYTNLCTIRHREQSIDVQTESDRVAREFSKRGDTELKESRWSNALSFYSRSLCFANSDERLSYGFANRATCFFEMKMFKECLVDIDLAKQYKYSKCDELEQWQVDCVRFIELAKQAESFVPQLSFTSHKIFPGLADVLQIERNQEFGLHITAIADIDAGKTVLMERAFTALSIGNEQRCSKCFSTYTNLVPCKRCTQALFCVDSCEICDIHRLECGLQMPKMISLIKGRWTNDQRIAFFYVILIKIIQTHQTQPNPIYIYNQSHGRTTWCEDLGMHLSNYFVLLHTKFLLKSPYWTSQSMTFFL